MSDLEGVHEKVLALVKKYPWTRESYPQLVLAYWNIYDGARIELRDQKVLKGLTSPESVTRAFRKVLEDHPELTPQVQPLRDEMEARHREAWR